MRVGGERLEAGDRAAVGKSNKMCIVGCTLATNDWTSAGGGAKAATELGGLGVA
jgi:hypothetical protein